MKEADDLVLVRECLNGNRKAFEAIVDRYQKPLFNVALRMLANAGDAEEVTQAAFVKAFEKLHTFDFEYKFFTWIYRIAINESINYRNARKHHDPVVDQTAAPDAETPETLYDARELRDTIEQALASISDEYRVVVILKHFQGLSYEEIARIIEIPVKTVKSRLFTARERLRELLLHQR